LTVTEGSTLQREPGAAKAATSSAPFEPRNPCVFVVGCPRSGTTLLQRMLDHHPQLAVANDTHFIIRAVPGLPPGCDPPLTTDLVERAVGHHRFHRLGGAASEARELARGARTYREFIAALYSRLAALRGKPLAGEKSPDYVKRLPTLASLFPWARTIHIVRDGRDVALSTREWAREDRGPGRFALWREEPMAVLALWWRELVRSGRRDGDALGALRYREVRYEDLVKQPDERLRELAAFLGLPFASSMSRFFEGRTRREPGLSAKKAWLPPTSGLRDWRTQMSERDTELFEAISGELLAELGYPRAFDAISPRVAAVAERCEAWWEAEMTRKRAKEARRARKLGLAR
jgi:hypothetical protein